MKNLVFNYYVTSLLLQVVNMKSKFHLNLNIIHRIYVVSVH